MDHCSSTGGSEVTHHAIRHTFHLAVNGGERHRFAILVAAECFAAEGYRVKDMTSYLNSPYVPDLVVSREERFVSGAHRKNAEVTYWVEVIDTSDPPRDFVRPPAEVVKIDISKCATFDACIEAIKRSIP